MGDGTGDAGADEGPPSRRLAALFVILLGLYYGVYYIFFSLRVSEYFKDVLKHFSFVRRLL
jgi:hypothetical protein